MKTIVSLLLTVILLFSSACAESATAALQELYAQGELLMVQGDYAGAAAKFEALGTYSDASQMAMYCKAIAAAETLGLYSMAVDAFNDLGDFKDSKQMAKYYEGRAHEAAGTIDVATASDGDLAQALWQLEEAEKVYGGLAFFKDSLTRYGACGERIKEIKGEQSRRAQIERERELARMEGVYQEALALEQNGDYAEAITLYRSLNGYKDSAERIAVCETAILDGKYDAAVALMEAGKYSEAIAAFEAIRNHRDSAEKIKACETAIQTAILDGKYDAAVALMEAGKYSEAYEAFVALNGYRDSAAKAESIYWKAIKVGDYITFGSYEQDNNTANGKEAVEWLVLAKENNRLLVISRYALDCKPFNDRGRFTTWATCTLRTWLNEDFLNNTFSNTEQAMIPTVTVSADKNPKYDTNPGNATQDKVFLLSVAEVMTYFETDNIQYGSAIECQVTAYARGKGAYYGKYSNNCMWWLRTPGISSDYVATADSLSGNSNFYAEDISVRPAMWIDLAP